MIAIGTREGKAVSEPVVEFVVHPMFDEPEEKLTGEGLGRMKMTPGVRLCLLGLRLYIVVIMGMLTYHLLDLAGVVGSHIAR
jgi:hypothetical protein